MGACESRSVGMVGGDVDEAQGWFAKLGGG